MIYLDGKYYVNIKDKRYKIHPTENIILRERDEPKSLRTQCQTINNTKIRPNQKVIKDFNNKLIVKSYPKKSKEQNIVKEKLKKQNVVKEKEKEKNVVKEKEKEQNVVKEKLKKQNVVKKKKKKKNVVKEKEKEQNVVNVSQCSSCQRSALYEYPSHYQCEICDAFIQKSTPEIDKKKVLRKEKSFGVRLSYADKKLKEI